MERFLQCSSSGFHDRKMLSRYRCGIQRLVKRHVHRLPRRRDRRRGVGEPTDDPRGTNASFPDRTIRIRAARGPRIRRRSEERPQREEEEEPVHRDASLYVGVKSCKMCHRKAEDGEQFAKWQESAHAKAFEKLASPEAKEVAKKLGIDDPQKSGKCLACHSTAYNWKDTVQNAELPVEEGVSCESCHGPGTEHVRVMADAGDMHKVKDIKLVKL